MADNSPKTLIQGGIPKNGDLLKYDSTLVGWVPTTLDAELASATKIGIYTLPAVDGNSGDQLTTNGLGVLSWAAP